MLDVRLNLWSESYLCQVDGTREDLGELPNQTVGLKASLFAVTLPTSTPPSWD